MSNAIVDYFRCPEKYVRIDVRRSALQVKGYFQFGPETICYGDYPSSGSAPTDEGHLSHASRDTQIVGNTTLLTFDPEQVIENLRYERYVNATKPDSHVLESLFASTYYFVRPALPIAVRKRILKAHLRRRNQNFPKWPADTSVDEILQKLLLLCLKSSGVERMPFIWFWPEGASSCAIMTHDIETEAGRNYCSSLMINDSFGIPA